MKSSGVYFPRRANIPLTVLFRLQYGGQWRSKEKFLFPTAVRHLSTPTLNCSTAYKNYFFLWLSSDTILISSVPFGNRRYTRDKYLSGTYKGFHVAKRIFYSRVSRAKKRHKRIPHFETCCNLFVTKGIPRDMYKVHVSSLRSALISIFNAINPFATGELITGLKKKISYN